jgi:predicted negative regulator of RcsB-dependent stress response
MKNFWKKNGSGVIAVIIVLAIVGGIGFIGGTIGYRIGCNRTTQAWHKAPKSIDTTAKTLKIKVGKTEYTYK